MKFFHLADLHIGKSVNGFSMLEDQRYILKQILEAVDAEKPDVVLIAGDIYDKAVPSGGAVTLFDEFLTQLAERGQPVLCIAGNHDSAERLEFASRLLQTRGIHIAGVFTGAPRQVELTDTDGGVVFHLLPFVRPAHVRAGYPDETIESTADAVRVVLAHNQLRHGARHVLVAHQFVLPAQGELERSDSETEPLGGTGGVPSALFDAFDYVALGHLHGPQQVGRVAVRYAGSPLKYSFSECRQKKSITVVELRSKGQVDIAQLPLRPLRDLRRIKGPFAALTAPGVVAEANPEDYLHITLTDEEEILDAMPKLRRLYPNAMELAFDNSRTRAELAGPGLADVRSLSPYALFCEFFEAQNGKEPTADQQAVAAAYLPGGEGSV